MKKSLLTLLVLLIAVCTKAQTTWQVCVEDPPSTTCPGKTGTFTPGNLVINQGDMIQFTTTMVLLGGYTGTYHDIQFTGYSANNVMLLVSSDIFNQVTTVTTPPFNVPGVYPMECVDFNHCILSEYSCTGYSVTVLPSCSVSAGFTTTSMNVCTSEIVDFTNSSTGATNYDWQLDGVSFSNSTDASLSFSTAGTYEVELVADDGSGCFDSTNVTINVDQESNAGANDSQVFCNIDDSIDLNTLVTGDAGGIWEEVTSSGQFNSSSGILNYIGLPQQDYTFNYIIAGVGACPNDTATMTITVNQEPDLTLMLMGTNIEVTDSLFVNFTTTGVLTGAVYSWEFCDGNTGNDSIPFFYSWPIQGNYCVCVTVDNGNGCMETFCDSSITVFDNSGLFGYNEQGIKIFPNPATSTFSIDISGLNGLVEIRIMDQLQRTVAYKQVEGGSIFTMNSRDFAAGTYYIHVVSGDMRTTQTIVFK